jgi:hypothetical protein
MIKIKAKKNLIFDISGLFSFYKDIKKCKWFRFK